MASITKNVRKDGIVSYRIQTKFKDENGTFKAKVMTWIKPDFLTEYQAQKELRRVACEFEQEVKRKSESGMHIGGDMKFCDYAAEWLERSRRDNSLVYSENAKRYLQDINKVIGEVPLNKITPVMIQKFIDDLCAKKVVDSKAILKEGFNLTMMAQAMGKKQKQIEEMSGVSRGTIFQANARQKIRIEKAESLCKVFNKQLDELFNIETKSRDYAKESIVKYKRLLSVILGTAKRQRLVEHNFASSDYIIPIKGIKNEVRILNDKEAKIFATALQNEPNIKTKTALMIVLFMGIRRGELAGLEWKDIDFENHSMKICRSAYDVSGYGIITKEPKTEKSKRQISIPDKLLEQLKTYREWWLNRRTYFTEVWGDTDRLFINDDGTKVAPSRYIVWLKRILKQHNLPQVTLHSLRHTNITLQLIAGIDLKTVSARAGHAKASTTSDFYSHYIRNSDMHASEIINKLFE